MIVIMIAIISVLCRSAYRHLNMLYEISIGFPNYKPLYWLNATAFFIMLKMYFIWLNCRRWALESFHVISWTFPSTHIIGFLFKILQVNGTKLLGWAISGQHKSSAISSFSLYCMNGEKTFMQYLHSHRVSKFNLLVYMLDNENANGF